MSERKEIDTKKVEERASKIISILRSMNNDELKKMLDEGPLGDSFDLLRGSKSVTGSRKKDHWLYALLNPNDTFGTCWGYSCDQTEVRKRNHLPTFKMLVQAVDSKQLDNCVCESTGGRRPQRTTKTPILVLAFELKNVEACKILLEAGASPNICTEITVGDIVTKEETVSEMASKSESEEMKKLFAKKD